MVDTPLTAQHSRLRIFLPRKTVPVIAPRAARTSAQCNYGRGAIPSTDHRPPYVLSKRKPQPRRPSATGSGRRDSLDRRNPPSPRQRHPTARPGPSRIARRLRSPATTTDLTRAMNVTASAASQHLAIMPETGLVAGRRIGRARFTGPRIAASTFSIPRAAGHAQLAMTLPMRQVQGEASGGGRDPGRDGDQRASNGRGRCSGQAWCAGECGGGAGEVERHDRADQPGGVRGEPPGWSVRQRRVLQGGQRVTDQSLRAAR
jgi:Bacterial regulatory protein, arsR family